ncbi:MAG: NAD-glutamate dehydrogenase, partial [Proteobacteria bacterium]|nr:NAD-glutamate dehydrogenase [Pseudomonadota bacterium]
MRNANPATKVLSGKKSADKDDQSSDIRESGHDPEDSSYTQDHFYNEDTIEENISPISGNRKMAPEDLDNYISDIAETVKIGLDHSISILTPWFFKNMPTIYYQTTPRGDKVRHLSAIITGHVFETKQTVDLWNRDKSLVTYIGPGGQSEILTAMARKISHLDLKMGSIYFSKDKLLFLATFHTKKYIPFDLANRHISDKLSMIKKILAEAFPTHQTSVDRFLASLDNDFITCSTELRTRLTYRMVLHMESHEGAHTFFEPRKDTPKRGRLSLGMKDTAIGQIYETVLGLIQRKFRVLRNFNICVDKGYESPITVMHFDIQHLEGRVITQQSPELLGLTKALRTLGWFDRDDYTQFMQPPFSASINAANLLRAMAVWTHVQLSKENAYYYSEYKIYHTLVSNTELTQDLLSLFRARFDHSISQLEREKLNAHYDKLKQDIGTKINEQLFDAVCQAIFRSCVSFIDHTLKTNYFLPTKTGSAFRLDPKILNSDHYPAQPFGIFFVVGRDYRFFQVRWKDISRGGMRVIMPQNTSGYSHALSGLFDEVFDLSFAQQMKNKDIPEGGSKAVLLVKPGGNRSRVVKGAVNALLDLLVENDESLEGKSSELLKYYKQDEIIYLGPDENMTNDLIHWISRQASRRGYLYARAFMSSKPGDGINHKDFGVTAEGLNVFLEHTLLYLGINPRKQSFSIKMTGGPSGDVAGNELKILHREYGENAKVLVIADGSGAAYDPQGLDWQEVLRLTGECMLIVHLL